MADPTTMAAGVSMPVSEALAWLAAVVAGALGAGIAGYRQFLKRCGTLDGPGVRGERVDALVALARSFEAFGQTVGAFIVHVQEQHGQHQREMERQTAIMDRLSQSIARVEARQEARPR